VNGPGTNNAFNRLFYTVYSTNITASGMNLTKVDLGINAGTPVTLQGGTWNTDPVWQYTGGGDSGYEQVSYSPYSGNPSGKATHQPTQQLIDGDTDLDLGCTGALAYNDPGVPVGNPPALPVPPYTGYWGGYDLGQSPTYSPIDSDGNSTGPDVFLNYWSPLNTPVKFAVSQAKHGIYSADPMGHGITQIYMVGKVAESCWRENGVVTTDGTPSTGGALTLYQVATAHNTSLEMSVNLTSSGLLNGTTSVGTMDHWIWQIRKHLSADPWVTVADVGSDTVALTLAMLQTALGTDPSKFGDYDIQLITKYASAVVLPNGPNGLPNGSTGTEQTLLHYTPEPGTMLFLAAGSAGLAFIRRRRSKK